MEATRAHLSVFRAFACGIPASKLLCVLDRHMAYSYLDACTVHRVPFNDLVKAGDLGVGARAGVRLWARVNWLPRGNVVAACACASPVSGHLQAKVRKFCERACSGLTARGRINWDARCLPAPAQTTMPHTRFEHSRGSGE
jgi:hypothetical protein